MTTKEHKTLDNTNINTQEVWDKLNNGDTITPEEAAAISNERVQNNDVIRTQRNANHQLRKKLEADGQGYAWYNDDADKEHDAFGTFICPVTKKEMGICLYPNWSNSDQPIVSKKGKAGTRLSVFVMKQRAEVQTDDDNGRYDNVKVKKNHTLEDGDKPTEERAN